MKSQINQKLILAGIVILGCAIMIVSMIYFSPGPGKYNPASEIIPPSHPTP